ncbi:MAG: hypothetical protein V1685_06950 [Parcubacteria group bacterium]
MDEEIRILIDLRGVIQKSRIAFGNRISAIERGADDGGSGANALYDRWSMRFYELEEALDKDIAKLVMDYEIVDYMTDIKGIGPMISAKIVCMIDITRADTVSALWRYCGYGLIDDKCERPVKGEKLHYNKRLKTACYLAGSSFLKSNSPYRAIYDEARVYYETNRPDWTKLHQHNASMRKMIKLFLAHLWVVWRTLENLPVREPYVIEKMQHTHCIRPELFGWKSPAKIDE